MKKSLEAITHAEFPHNPSRLLKDYAKSVRRLARNLDVANIHIDAILKRLAIMESSLNGMQRLTRPPWPRPCPIPLPGLYYGPANPNIDPWRTPPKGLYYGPAVVQCPE